MDGKCETREHRSVSSLALHAGALFLPRPQSFGALGFKEPRQFLESWVLGPHQPPGLGREHGPLQGLCDTGTMLPSIEQCKRPSSRGHRMGPGAGDRGRQANEPANA